MRRGRVSARIFFVLALLLAPWVGNAQSTSVAVKPPAEIRAFLDQASGLPIEYRADLVVSLLNQAPAAFSPAERKRLVTSIIDDASHARYKTPLLDAAPGDNLLMHQEALNLSWLHIDTLELQLHGLAMLHEDPWRTFVRFKQMRIPSSRATCEDAVLADDQPYYNHLAMLLNTQAVRSKMGESGRQLYLAESLKAAVSPSQLRAFLKAYASLSLEPAEMDMMRPAIVAALSSVTASDREMTGIEGRRGEMTEVVKALLSNPTFLGVNRVSLLAAYRAFLVSGLHTEACSGSTLDRESVVRHYNALDADLIGAAPKPVPSLSLADVVPTRLVETPHFESISQNVTKQDELHRLFGVFAANQKAHDTLSPEQAYTQPNAEDVRAVLREATSAEPYGNDHDSALLRYENRQSNLMLLIDLLPPGPSFQDAVDAEAAFLNLNPVEQLNPPAWLRALKQLILISRPTSGEAINQMKQEIADGRGLIMLPSPDAGFIRSTLMRYESDRIISAYMSYETLVHPPYVSFEQSDHVW